MNRKFVLLGFSALMMLMLLVGTTGAALAAPSPTGATIASDLADYPPGATVTLTGSGWAPGESVRIVTNDTIGQTWKRDVTVTADAAGNVSDVFALPNYFVSDYDVTATGPTSGSATTTFTDAPPATAPTRLADFYPRKIGAVVDGLLTNGSFPTWQSPPSFSLGSTGDFFSNMYEAGNSTKDIFAYAYMRYTCQSTSSATIYVLVMDNTADAYPIWTQSGHAWGIFTGEISNKLYTDSSGNDGTPPDFQWINPTSSNTADGYEASFTVNPTDPKLDDGLTIHVDVVDSTGAGKTAATTGFSSQNPTVQAIKLDCSGGGPVAQDLTVSKTAAASFTRTFGWTIAKSADKTTVYSAGGGESEPVNYTVSVTKDAGTDSAFAVDGTITVHNPNAFAVNGVSLSDTIDNGGACTLSSSSVDVPAGGDASATYHCTFASSPGSGTNVATATWSDIGSPNTSASGSKSYAFGAPTKLVNDAIDVTDTNGGSWHFAASGSASYDQTYTDPAGTCTSHTNTATITGGASSSVTVKDCQGANLTVSKTADTSFTRTYQWDIAKSVDNADVKTAGGAPHTYKYTIDVTKDAGTDGFGMSGKITVSNPNDWQAITANVSDSLPGCSVVGGTGVSIPAGQSVSLDYSCSFASNPGSGTNTATATWDKTAASTPSGSASGSASYAFGAPTKLVNDAIDVTDTNGGSWHFAASGSASYDQTYTDPAGTCTSHTNTATITGGASSSVTVTDCQGADLTVSKTANPSFTRTYNWMITKNVDKTLVQQFGGTATFNYTVNAWQTGYTDSAFALSGKITVSNPNDWQAITADVTDSLPGCSVAGGTGVSIPAGQSVSLDYSCSFASNPGSGTNTATASWDSAAYSTPSGSASGSASYAFGAPTTTVNKTITVTDTFNGGTTTLGTLTATDATPYASATYGYAKTVSVPANDCMSYTNIARIVETGQNASQTVKVCGPAKTGALTMGYWMTKNGQTIVQSYSGNNCQALKTWLATYKQFNESALTSQTACGTSPAITNKATTTPTGVVGYVYTTIKNASASGASMAAMLKGQTLATALNVYFSDPALGGNRINAPAPIGSVLVDLTRICTDLTCTAFEDSNSQFSSTTRSVLEMLSDSSAHSNLGGTTWSYGSKFNEELAKDAFDALNNSKVFAP